MAGIALGDRRHGGEVAAGAVAAHRDALGVDAERGRVRAHPAQRREAVVDGGRKAVLRRQPVVHRDDDATGAQRQLPARHVVGVEVADRPAAAVVVDQHRQRFIRLRAHRAHEPDRNRSMRPVSAQFAHFAHARRFGPRELRALTVSEPRLPRAQRVHRGDRFRCEQVEQRAGLRVNHGDRGSFGRAHLSRARHRWYLERL